MPIPADVSTANIDSDQDDPRLWRADGLDHMQKFNELLEHFRTPGHVETTDLADGSVTDAKLAAPSRIRGKLDEWLIKDFYRGIGGTPGDPESDATDMIQQAAASGENVKFINGRYNVYESIVMDKRRQCFYGETVSRTTTPDPNRTAIIRLMTPDIPLFHVKEFGVGFRNLGFLGAGNSEGQHAIYCVKDEGADASLDCYIDGCAFSGWEVVTLWQGWGSHMYDCVAGTCDVLVDLAFPAPGDFSFSNDPSSTSALETGFRGSMIENIKAHGVRVVCRNTGAQRNYLKGVSINGIHADIGATIFEGVLKNSEICGVVIANTRVPALDLRNGSTNFVVSNLAAHGSKEGTYDRRPDNLILMDGSVTDGQFHGITLGQTKQAAIKTSGGIDVDFFGLHLEDVAMDSGVPVEHTTGTAYLRINGFRHRKRLSYTTPDAIFGGAGASGLTVELNDRSKARLGGSIPLAEAGVTLVSGDGIGPVFEETVSSNAFTYRGPNTVLSAETAASVTAINGGFEGDLLYITVSGSAPITLVDGSDLALSGDFTLDNIRDQIVLRKRGSRWIEVSRSDNQ